MFVYTEKLLKASLAPLTAVNSVLQNIRGKEGIEVMELGRTVQGRVIHGVLKPGDGTSLHVYTGFSVLDTAAVNAVTLAMYELSRGKLSVYSGSTVKNPVFTVPIANPEGYGVVLELAERRGEDIVSASYTNSLGVDPYLDFTLLASNEAYALHETIHTPKEKFVLVVKGSQKVDAVTVKVYDVPGASKEVVDAMRAFADEVATALSDAYAISVKRASVECTPPELNLTIHAVLDGFPAIEVLCPVPTVTGSVYSRVRACYRVFVAAVHAINKVQYPSEVLKRKGSAEIEVSEDSAARLEVKKFLSRHKFNVFEKDDKIVCEADAVGVETLRLFTDDNFEYNKVLGDAMKPLTLNNIFAGVTTRYVM